MKFINFLWESDTHESIKVQSGWQGSPGLCSLPTHCQADNNSKRSSLARDRPLFRLVILADDWDRADSALSGHP